MRYLPLALLLAWTAAGADYPASAGYMNDLAGMIPDAVQQSLELRLRAYERATSNEIAVAIVPSLDGQTVDEYAKGLFRAWRIGKAEKNNGVLFLWAPNERQLRIEVGYGLEQSLTNPVCADILGQATRFFRGAEYGQGVQAVVDGIIARLGEMPAVAPKKEERSGGNDLFQAMEALGFGVLALAGVLMLYHAWRTHRLQHEIPQRIGRLSKLLDEAGPRCAQAEADMAALREEAPGVVCADLPERVAAMPEQLQAIRRELNAVQDTRREEYREWNAAHHALRHAERQFSAQERVMADVHDTLERFRAARDAALLQLPSLPERMSLLAERLAAESNERAQKVFDAAQENCNRVNGMRSSPPVNWLLAGDLLEDAQACLRCATVLLDPEADGKRIRGVILQPSTARLWNGSDEASPAAGELAALAAVWRRTNMGMDAQQIAAQSVLQSNNGGYDGGGFSGGGFGGGDSGGGFGGGDTGGGGASASY